MHKRLWLRGYGLVVQVELDKRYLDFIVESK